MDTALAWPVYDKLDAYASLWIEMRWDLYVWNKFRVTSSLSCLDVRAKSFRVYQNAVIFIYVSLITDRTVYETLIP
jgi:hypothetical protein